MRTEPIPQNLMDQVKEKKLELLACLADFEPKMEEYFLNENWNCPAKELKQAIRK